MRRSLLTALLTFWKDGCSSEGLVPTSRRFFSAVTDFLRGSTPSQKKQRYGDVDYDWEHRVDTTSATVGWRSRFIGCLNSPYQPTEAGLFHQMMRTLAIKFEEFTFIDIGAGKGRALLLAADYPFRRIVGVELLPELHAVAQENLRRYSSASQKCLCVETICGDAKHYEFPGDSLVVYLFNPLPEIALTKMVGNLVRSIKETPRTVYVLYHNPLLGPVFAESSQFSKIFESKQYAVYAHPPGAEGTISAATNCATTN